MNKNLDRLNTYIPQVWYDGTILFRSGVLTLYIQYKEYKITFLKAVLCENFGSISSWERAKRACCSERLCSISTLIGWRFFGQRYDWLVLTVGFHAAHIRNMDQSFQWIINLIIVRIQKVTTPFLHWSEPSGSLVWRSIARRTTLKEGRNCRPKKV